MSEPTLPDWGVPFLKVKKPSPDWFKNAINHPFDSHFVEVEGCPIHYLKWHNLTQESTDKPGILFIHGGGAHANWWRFTAPLLADSFEVAAIDLSGMGDSGNREEYSAAIRAVEIREVLRNCQFNKTKFVVGHSFGGYMSMRFGADYGDEIDHMVIVDSPIRHPDDPEGQTPRRALSVERYYPSFDIALERFRLMPPQDCDNKYLVEFIARHSLRETSRGWTWKFDVEAMGKSRWGEPFHEHIRNLECPSSLIYGEQSALVSADTAKHMSTLMGPSAAIIEIKGARHHIMLDRPLEFADTVRHLLTTKQETSVGKS